MASHLMLLRILLLDVTILATGLGACEAAFQGCGAAGLRGRDAARTTGILEDVWGKVSCIIIMIN